jgi:hypothetical protein
MELMTAGIAERLIHNDKVMLDTGECDDAVVVKYFDPMGAATWHVVSGTPLNADGEPDYEAGKEAADWHLFGHATLGDPWCAELGYVMLSELQSIAAPGRLGIERDLHMEPTTLKEVQEKTRALRG